MHSEFQTAKNLFRRCGGSIYNAKRSVGILGAGLFKVDSEKPSAIYVPEKLLVDSKRLAIKNERMVLLDAEELSRTSSSFLRFYIDNFINNGIFGITEARSFALFLDSSEEIWMTLGLNKKQKRLKSQQGGLLKVLANSRFIGYKNRKVLFPMLELINHSAMGKEFRFYSQNAITKQNETGICIYQREGQELLANYGKTFDSILIFKNYGFFSKEDKAYSLPLTIPFESKNIVILAKNNSNKAVPELTNGEIVFEKLLLYEKHSPAKAATKALMEFNKIAGPKSSTILIKIISSNIEAVNLAIIKANSLPSDHYKNSLVECLLYQKELLEKSLEATSKLKT